MALRLTVLVPTYRRVKDLARCLDALAAQDRPADQIVVTVRDSDEETLAFLRSRPGVEVVVVSVPGVVAAMNAGLAAATGDVVALTDDDGAPRPPWLGQIEAHFLADAKLGALGGKDWQHYDHPAPHENGQQDRPGEMSWFGRVTGQHHWATPGAPREVDVLKGVNLAVRAGPLRPIGFDTRLAGSGAQVHWELSLCLALKRAGWKIVFDPAVAVDHYPATRHDEDQRCQFNANAQRNMVFNETLVLSDHLPLIRRTAFLTWALLCGTRVAPGVMQVARLLMRREHDVLPRWQATFQGRWQAKKHGVAHRES